MREPQIRSWPSPNKLNATFGLKVGDRLRFQVAGRIVDAPLVAVFRRQQRAPVRYDLVFPDSALKDCRSSITAPFTSNPAEFRKWKKRSSSDSLPLR